MNLNKYAKAGLISGAALAATALTAAFLVAPGRRDDKQREFNELARTLDSSPET